MKNKSTKELTKKVAKLSKLVKRTEPEHKQWDLYQTLSGVGTAGYVAPVFYNPSSTSYMIEGTSNIDRIGSQIRCQSMELKGSYAIADTTNLVRFIIFKDKSSDGVVPSVISVLQPTAGGVTATVYSPLNKLNLNRYTIIYDSFKSGVYASDSQVITFKKVKK